MTAGIFMPGFVMRKTDGIIVTLDYALYNGPSEYTMFYLSGSMGTISGPKSDQVVRLFIDFYDSGSVGIGLLLYGKNRNIDSISLSGNTFYPDNHSYDDGGNSEGWIHYADTPTRLVLGSYAPDTEYSLSWEES